MVQTGWVGLRTAHGDEDSSCCYCDMDTSRTAQDDALSVANG